jgi:hypothetical protein
MPGDLKKIDSGILQFTPKGAYYEGKDEQYNAVNKMWFDLFHYDRTLFGLLLLLNGTGFSKGAMTRILLANPQEVYREKGKPDMLPAQFDGLPATFENEIIRYSLYKEKAPRALKNLLMLAGGENQPRVNNSRTRKLILDYIFNRDNKSLEYLAINYKGKLQKLIRHALGKQDLQKLLGGNNHVFQKFVGRYNKDAFPVVCHIFNCYELAEKRVYFPLLDEYDALKQAAIIGDVDEFRNHMKSLPIRTVMGMRNLYKVRIKKSELYEKTKLSTKDTIQMQAASKKAGAKKVKINYKKQDIYDLFKFLYFKIRDGEMDDIDELFDAIEEVQKIIPKVDVGKCVVVMDASHSMMGSEERPLHPFLTGLSIISTLENIVEVIYVGGHRIDVLGKGVATTLPIPYNHTDLWRGLIKAVETGVENIVVISDGYENTVKGMFKHVYDHLRKAGYNFKLTHINPVFAASSSNGTGRKLVDDINPMPVGDHKFLETEVIFSKMIEDKDMVKKLLIRKYQNLLQ